MTITYTVAIDWNDDGDFADSGEDITADVLHLAWRLGMAAPYDHSAAPGWAKITVRSVNRAYSPEYTSNPLKPGKAIYIRSNDGSTARTHFTGVIHHIEPQPGSQGERTAVIHAFTVDHQFAAARLRLPAQVNVTADVVIGKILDALPLRRPVLNGYLILGVSGYNIIGTHKLFGQNWARALEVGKSVFAYVGDTWLNGIPADHAIRQLVESERGRFFIDRSGQAIFYNRHHTLFATTSAATFNNNMDGLVYADGAEVINRVTVDIMPRTVGSSGTTLWTLATSLALSPGEGGVRRVVARYRDTNERPLGALAVIPPQAYSDYTANSQADGSGSDKTAQVTVILLSADSSAATLEFHNNGRSTVYLQAGSKLRGTPLVPGDPMRVEQSNAASVTFYGLNSLSLDLPALTSLDEADQLARYEIARRKDPRGIVRQLQASGTHLMGQVLARTLFDRITVQDTQTNHSADYFIIAEEHRVDLGGARHQVIWLLESADSDVYFLIGAHKPDGSRVLAY
jgi:hypothetical protein